MIVFQIPQDEVGGGQLVVHRVVGIRDDGTYMTQGDNSDDPDEFETNRADILGSPRFAIPHGGQAIAIIGSPLGLAVAIGGLCTALLWPRKRDEATDDDVPSEVPEQVPLPIAPRVSDPDFDFDFDSDSDFAIEAEAWLREQLATIGQPVS